MFHHWRIFILLPVLGFFTLCARSQGPIAPPRFESEPARAFESSLDGLRQQLQEILAAAKDGNRPKLEFLIGQLEIPNYGVWFTTTFGKEKGESWAGPYGRDLHENENDMASRFLEMGTEKGELEVRKLNDAPRSGLESGMINALQRPLEIYYAGWKQPPPRPPFTNELVGYFVFLDGRFRWDSTILPLKVTLVGPGNEDPPQDAPTSGAGIAASDHAGKGPFHAGVGGVTFPMCTYCPSPEFTKEARAKHIEGTAILQAIIQPDGRITDITVVKGIDGGLTEKAIEAVSKWRFNPAHGPDGEPVPVIVPIEVTFRLAN
jgi:periplasmic protein TonB